MDALKDSHPAVRRLALRLAEEFKSRDSAVAIIKVLQDMSISENSPEVLLQLAYSLGEFEERRLLRAWQLCFTVILPIIFWSAPP